MISIKVKQIKDPGHFFCREIDSESASEEHQQFLQLQEEINQTFNEEQIVNVPYIPCSGEICIGLQPSDKKWYRVRCEGIFARKHGQEACCYLVDLGGDTVSINIRWLRKSPRRFLKLPFQVKECCLFGVKALTMAIQEDLTVTPVACLKWDVSAITFMEKKVKRSKSTSAEVLYVDKTNRVHLKLFLDEGNGKYNLNELLVEKNYAVVDETDGLIKNNEGKRTINRNTRHLQTLLAESFSFSDSEILGEGKHMLDSDAENDRKFNFFEDKEYLSDTAYRNKHVSPSKRERRSAENYHRSQNTSGHKDYFIDRTNSSTHVAISGHITSSADHLLTTSDSDSSQIIPRSFSMHNPLSDTESRGRGLLGNLGRGRSPPGSTIAGRERESVSPIAQHERQKSPDCRRNLHFSGRGASSYASVSPTGMGNSAPYGRGVVVSPNLSISPVGGGSSTVSQRGVSPNSSAEHFGRGIKSSSFSSSNVSMSGRGNLPPTSSLCQSLSRGRGQLDLLRLAMNSRLPTSSPSSASDIDSDHKCSSNLQVNSHLFEKLRVTPAMPATATATENAGARPKAYKPVPGQFDDSESDAISAYTKQNSGISVGSLLKNDKSLTMARGRLPKAALSKVGASSGSDMDSSKNKLSLINQQDIVSSKVQDFIRNEEVKRDTRIESDIYRSPSQIPENASKRCIENFSSSTESDSSPSKVKSPRAKDMTEGERRRADMISKLQGNQLLSILKPGNQNVRGLGGIFVKSATERGTTDRMDNFDNVLVHSIDTIKPIFKIEEAPIGKLMKEAFRQMDFTAPKLIQAYAWKSVLRGMNFIGLAPPDSGKTFAYLVPIISQIFHTGSYQSLPKGPGPYAVILVPSWKKVQNLYYTGLSLLQGDKKIRIIDLYGSQEDLKMIPLINGCEILVATPPSLKRVLEHQYVHLNRLCHLVVDDAEITLTNYTEEIQFIVSNYSTELRKQEERTAPQQLMLFGTQWDPVVRSFAKSYMLETVIAITSRYEASLYGKVRQIPMVHHSQQKPITLLNILEDILSDKLIKLIIFASSVSLACLVDKLLKSRSQYCLLAHHDMDKFDINEVGSNWHCMDGDEPAILITTDLSIPHLYINNATVIVHYDLPDSKTKFGNRMSCMSSHYWNFLYRETKQAVVPTSYIMITEESTDKIDTIASLLTRSKVKLPDRLRQMLAGRMEAINLHPERKLCVDVKAFGKCRNEDRCKSRHLVVPKVDGGSKFISGYVKIRITNIDDASHFHGIIQGYKSLDGTVTDFRCNYAELLFQMSSYFGNIDNRIRHTNMCPGDLCAYEYNDMFHRVKILDIVNLNSKDSLIEADVKFVDDGKEERVQAKKLYDLPQKLKSVPFQTVDIFICRVKPVDRDDDWTPRANTFMHKLIQHKELDGRIVLSMDNTLWLDPLVELIELRSVQTIGRKMNVRSELLKNGFAVDNPKHLEDLYKVCKDKITVPDINKDLHKSEKGLTVDILPESRQFHDVYVSAVHLPNLFFVQRKETCKQLERMMDSLNVTMEHGEDDIPYTGDLEDAVCAARFPDDNRWYRVKVLSTLNDDDVEVFYGDYGDKRTINRCELFHLPQMYMDLPFQAIECELAYVQPRGDEWDEESGDLFWDLTHMVCDDKKCVVAKIVWKHPADYAGIHRYTLEMYDTDTSYDVNLAQELVFSSLASPTPDSTLQELCPVPQMIRKVYKSPVQKIPDLCTTIYWERNTEKAKAAPKEIYTIVKQNVTSAPLELIGYKALAAIIKLIGRISYPPSHQWMLESLFSAAKASERLRTEIIEQECGIGIVKCLEQNSRQNIQLQAVIAIDKFMEISQSFLSVFGDSRTIEILCQLLDVSEINSTLVEIYKALSALCSASSKICDMAISFDVCTTVQKHLEKIGDQTVEEAALMYLIKLMERSAEQLRKDKLMRAVVGVLDRTVSDQCISYCVKICDNYCHDKGKNKTTLLEHGLAITLSKILSSNQISKDSRKSCQSLHDSLVIKVPHSTSITNRPTGHHQEQSLNGSVPEIHWVQNTFRVVVSVKIKAVHTCDVIYTSKSIEFRTKVVDGKLYKFFYELYDDIIPSKCKYEIKGSEVKISLRKVEKGKWPRLLRQKQKPSNISVDYERFLDSSSDSEVCDDDRPFVLKKNKKKQLPSNMKRPKKTGEENLNEDSSEDSSSVSDEELKYKTSADYDPYDIFN